MKTLNRIILTSLIGASLTFGAGNKTKAQCECQIYNHDADEFPEEIICYKTKEPNKKEQTPIVTRVVV